MKKLLSAFIVLAMIAMLTAVSFAETDPKTGLTYGGVYIKEDDDDDYYTDLVDELAPGETGWIYLGAYDNNDDDSKEKPYSISITDGEFTADGEADDKDEDGKEYAAKKLISISSKAEKKKINSSNPKYGWFAKLSVKNISASKYPEDGYDVTVPIMIEFSWDNGDEDDFEVLLDAICYEEADDEFEDDTKLFKYDKDDDVDIDLPDDDGTFTGVARKDFEITASMNTKVNNSLLNKYPNADIRFYNGNGANFPVTNGRLTIKGNSGDHCYKVESSGKLVDMSSSWSSSKNAFVIKTTVIGKYIVSDTKLSSSSTVAEEPEKPTINEYIGAVAPGTNLSAPVGSRTYTVVAGDSLWGIAQRQLGNGWRYPEIVQLNGLRSNFIYSGQVLKLPNA